MLKQLIAVILFSLAAANVQALTVTLTHDGNGGVIADLSGSGAVVSGGDQLLWRAFDGDPFKPTTAFTDDGDQFSLLSPVNFSANPDLDVVNLFFRVNVSNSPFALRFPSNSDLEAGDLFALSGTSAVDGLSFDDLNIGNYLSEGTTGAGSAVVGDLTLIIQDITPVPLPAAAWLFVTALGGLMGFKRLKPA